MMQPSTASLDKLDEVLNKILGSVSEKDAVKQNVFSSVWITYVNNVGQFPENKNIVDNLASKNLSTYEEFEKAINETKVALEQSSFDTEKALKESVKEVLTDFISGVEPELPPEKISEFKELLKDF